MNDHATESAAATTRAVIDSAVLAQAEDDLAEAEERAGVEMRLIHTAEEAANASMLLDEVWNVGKAGTTQLEPGLLVALAHAGNYVAAAYEAGADTSDPEAMIGVTVGFFGMPLGQVMHSHIAGVRHHLIGRGTGAAMKLHQRLWCLNTGITEMTWTFDPLIARNAYFNFQRLGVDAVEYFEDFYGQMRDGVNAGQASDRMLVSWKLDQPARRDLHLDPAAAFYCLRADDTGAPHLGEVPKEAQLVALDFPADMETLRGTDASLATQWREALRAAIKGLIADGWQIETCLKGGTYLLTHP